MSMTKPLKITGDWTWFIVLELTISISIAAPAPALPPRRTPSKVSGYENLPSKGAEPLPSRERSCEGYVNLPARQDGPASNGPPPLPPKAPSQGLQGYENLPTKDASSSRTRNLPYENIGANGTMFYILSSVDMLGSFVKHFRDTAARRKLYTRQERHLLTRRRSNSIPWCNFLHTWRNIEVIMDFSVK